MVRPRTARPCCWSRAATAELSTPPDMATATTLDAVAAAMGRESSCVAVAIAISRLYRVIVLSGRSQPTTRDADGVARGVFGVGEFEAARSVNWAEFEGVLFCGGFEGANVRDTEDQLDGGTAGLRLGSLVEGDGAASVRAGEFDPINGGTREWKKVEVELIKRRNLRDVLDVKNYTGEVWVDGVRHGAFH